MGGDKNGSTRKLYTYFKTCAKLNNTIVFLKTHLVIIKLSVVDTQKLIEG